MSLTPTFQILPARFVVGMGGNFISVLSPDADNFIVIPKLWHEFMARSGEITPRKDSTVALGCVYCPAGERPGECHYLACAEVTAATAAEVSLPAGMELREIPAGRHAVFIHKGSLDTLGDTMGHIYATWLPASGLELRDAPDLEIYGEKFCMESEDSELEICIPVAG